MANLTTTVRNAEGQELFRLSGRQPREDMLAAAKRYAEFQASSLEDSENWTVTTQRGSVPAQSYEEHNG